MSTTLTCYLQSIEICSPGMMSWQQAIPVFSGASSYQIEDDAVPKANILSSRDRRRASDTVNLCLSLAERAQQQSLFDAKVLQTVFASSDGDGDIFDYLARELSQPEPAISPTKFHQSLHNSAAGYWGIATESQTASLSISAADSTFSSGLLTAASESISTKKPVLFVAYNLLMPAPMDECCSMLTWFGVSMVLSAEKHPQTMAKLSLSLVDKQLETKSTSEKLELLRTGNAMARCLPLLAVLANQQCKTVFIDYFDSQSLCATVEEYFK